MKKNSKILIIILTIIVLIIIGFIIVKEINKKEDPIYKDNNNTKIETLNDYIQKYLITTIETNAYYRILSYKENDIYYYAIVDNNDKFVEKFNSSYNYKLYNFSYDLNNIDTKWYCELKNDVCNLKYEGNMIKENINLSDVSIENKETLKIKIYNNDLTYMYYDINSGNNIKNDLYKVYPIETTSKAIIVNEELGYRLIDMDTKEPLSSNYSYMGFDLVKERFNIYLNNNLIVKSSDNKYGLISLDGNILIDCIYDNLNLIIDGYYSYIVDNKVNLININNEIIKENYDFILGDRSKYIMLIKDNNYEFYNKNLEEVSLDTIRNDYLNIEEIDSISFMSSIKSLEEYEGLFINLNKYDFEPFTVEDIESTYNFTYTGSEYKEEYILRFVYFKDNKIDKQSIYVIDTNNNKLIDITSSFDIS